MAFQKLHPARRLWRLEGGKGELPVGVKEEPGMGLRDAAGGTELHNRNAGAARPPNK